MRKLLGIGVFLSLGVLGAAAAPEAHACKHARYAAKRPVEPTAAAEISTPAPPPVVLISSTPVAVPAATSSSDEPLVVAWARDYGRTLLLLAAPAAFVGLALRLRRRGEL
jgi:hypothetical protein